MSFALSAGARRSLLVAVSVAAWAVLASGAGAPLAAQVHAGHASAAAAGSGVSLRDDLGGLHRAVTTRSPEAQAWFDQGLRLHFAFNHAAAVESFREALRHDPECAMCWWGVALSSGNNINGPMTDEGGREAYRAAAEARRREAGVSAVERDLIRALSARYGPDPARDRPALDSAWARAMETVAGRHPHDAGVQTLYAAALMNLSPWNYWEGPFAHRSPRPGTERILATLERAVALAPEHPGACHYFIHLVEAAEPQRAVECAERLAGLMPGAGHIVHMPGHIYIRVGRYADAVTTNEHAVHADESGMGDVGRPTLYTGAYYPHNYHFMAFAATMAGMSRKAVHAARTVAPKVPVEVARDVYWIQNAVALPALTDLTFGRWEEVLSHPLPPAELEQATVMALFARGVALAATGRIGDAREVLADIRARAAGAATDPATDPVPHIAPLVLAGEIARRSGDADAAVEAFGAAAGIEDSLLYDEPPLWYRPVRHWLGAALLEAGRPREAGAAYREDLDRFPENGWSLFGLAESLEAQGRTAEAEEVRERFRAAWTHADVELVSSSF